MDDVFGFLDSMSLGKRASRSALLPRIYVLGDLVGASGARKRPGACKEPACDMMQESVGFRYSMEHWLHRILSSNEAIHVDTAEVGL